MKKKIGIYDIESGVPLGDATPTVPLGMLEVGESVRFPLELRENVQSMASYRKKQDGKEFTVKKVDEQYARVWRVK